MFRASPDRWPWGNLIVITACRKEVKAGFPLLTATLTASGPARDKRGRRRSAATHHSQRSALTEKGGTCGNTCALGQAHGKTEGTCVALSQNTKTNKAFVPTPHKLRTFVTCYNSLPHVVTFCHES